MWRVCVCVKVFFFFFFFGGGGGGAGVYERNCFNHESICFNETESTAYCYTRVMKYFLLFS